MLRRKIMLIMIILILLPIQVHSTVSQGWERHVIATQHRPIYLYVKDLDKDGDLDVVSTTNEHPYVYNSEVAWFRNNLNQGEPWEYFIIDSSTGTDPVTNANGIVISDIDGDGHEDVAVGSGIVTGYKGGVYWYKAPEDPTDVWQRFTIEEGTFDSYFKIDTMDANNDGLKDIVVGGRRGAVIFLNPGNPAQPEAVWEKVALPEGTGSSVYLDDLNGDSRLDIVNSYLHGNVSWIDVLYQDGQLVFNRTMIEPNLDYAFDVNCLDVNGDSKKDVLVTVFTTSLIYWYENPESSDDPWIQHLVTDTYEGSDIFTGDINRDGKTDFVASGLNDMKISWFEYQWENGQAVWTEHLIDDDINEPGDNSLNDLDGDGDLDLVVCGLKDDQMIWYENKINPPVIELSKFIAITDVCKVTIRWITKSEADNTGFNLYRSTSIDGEYTKLNRVLIPSRGSVNKGASYKFVDRDVKNRRTYYYKLENIAANGQSIFHGPISATPGIGHQ